MVKSIKVKLSRTFLLLICFALFCCLSGCGNGETKATNTGTGTTTTDLSSLILSIPSSVVTFGTPVTATATLRDANGALVPNAVVTFAATSGLVTFTPTSASALTSASGVASIVLNAASFDSAGATSITASASVTTEGTTTTVTSTPVGIVVNGASVTLGTLTLGQPSISSYGTSSVSVPVLIDGAPATVPISVTFTSSCVSAGKATLTTPVTTVAGTATSTYKDNDCASGTDLITASITGFSASATITVATPATSNIQFVSATPSVIGASTASAASLPTSSLVKFKVVDSNNSGKPGVLVDFTTVPPSPTSLFTLSASSATSDADGYVTTSLSSGTIPTPVWVVATVHGTSIKSQSNTLTITTGLPTQDFFSLSVQTYNIEGWDYDGMKSTLTIIASDRLGNPVPDGTAINFITEGAQITASCKTTGGTCSVTFTSAELRPTNGRVTILASAIGEKSFIDTINNNSYDVGETFYDLGDPYIDANENGQWDAGEFYIPSTTSGSSLCLTRPGGGALPINYWNVPSKENTCTGTWGQNYVRRSAVIVLSGSYAYITAPHTINMGSSCTASFSRMLMDLNGNPMPAGTTVDIANNNVYYQIDGGGISFVTVSIDNGTPVLNTNNLGGTPITITVSGSCSGSPVLQYPQGSVDIVVTTPKLLKTTIPFTVTGNTTTIIPSVAFAFGSTSVKAGAGTALTATVTDQFGYQAAGQTVTFSFTTNNSGGSLSKTSVITDSLGHATVNYVAGSTFGVQDTIKASVVGGSSDTVVISVTP